MKPTETRIFKIWEDTAEIINGEFSMSFRQINGGMMTGGVYLLKLVITYKSEEIVIHTGLDEYPMRKDEYNGCDIVITTTKETHKNIELSVWRKDFLDRFLSFNKSNTGYKEFDKIIGLSSSRNIERYLPKIFESDILRAELISDKYRAYNIQTVDNEIIVQRKSGLKMNNSQMIIEEYKRYCLFLDGLLTAKII